MSHACDCDCPKCLASPQLDEPPDDDGFDEFIAENMGLTIAFYGDRRPENDR